MQQQGISLSYRARHGLVAQMALRYREASLARKRMMLDSLVEMTGYARPYAIGLLNQETQGSPTIRRPQQPHYGSEVQQALFAVWRSAPLDLCQTPDPLSLKQDEMASSPLFRGFASGLERVQEPRNGPHDAQRSSPL